MNATLSVAQATGISTPLSISLLWALIPLGILLLLIIALMIANLLRYQDLVKKGVIQQTAYFGDAYDKGAEHNRGILLLILFSILFLADLFFWMWHHQPGMLQGKWDWIFPSLEATDQTKTIDATKLGLSVIDWLLAGLGGALLYALGNIVYRLPQVKYKKAEFRAWTGWYLVNSLRGGIIAVIVLLLLTNLSVAVGQGGIDLNFAKMPGALLTGAAFILGYYGHVAKAQLDEITSTLFRRAWLAAEGRFQITPGDLKVIFGRQQQFKVDPAADVAWSAPLGTIDGVGLYTAPQRSESATPGTRVQIRAALQADPKVSDVVIVTLVPFILVDDKLPMSAGESRQLRVDSPPPEGVHLEAKYGTMDGMKYTAPAKTVLQDKGISADTVVARRVPKPVVGDEAATRKEEEAAKLDFDGITIRLKSDG